MSVKRRLIVYFQINGAFVDLSFSASTVAEIVSTFISEGKDAIIEGFVMGNNYNLAAYSSNYLFQSTISLAQDDSISIGLTKCM
jgi:hypothetical protein